MNKLYDYAVDIRRKLHEFPEVGFDLDKTVKLVSAELEKMGIAYTYKYGKGSIVTELGQGSETIALRADMDALPVEEKTDLPYKSKIPGQMHACGHDAHTAILLAVAKHLKAHEKELAQRVRLIFQPSEEGQISGAKMMVDNGVCEGVSHIICTHCDNDIDAGKIGICYGDYMAACIPLTVSFFGKTSHAALPQFGIDANAMAVEAYIKLKEAVRGIAGDTPYIWNVGRIEGGHVHNVVSDKCEMDISFRFYDMDFAKKVEEKTREICNDIATHYGGSVDINWNMSTYPVYNDIELTKQFESICKEAGLSSVAMPQRMSSEDFAHYLTKSPGMIFRFGTRNEALGCTALAHRNDFCIDEEGMKTAIKAFCAYVFNVIEKG